MSSQGIRFDILVLNSGATAESVRARLAAALDLAADPVVLVRRQGIGAVTWYRVGLKQLAAAAGRADDAATLSTILILDAANEVPATQMGTVRGIDLGVMLVGDEPIAFLEGVPEPSGAEPTRGPHRVPPVSPARPPIPLPSMPAQAEPDGETSGHDAFSAYPVIDAPTIVQPDAVFEVAIGVSSQSVRHTTSERMVVSDLPPDLDTIRLQVLVTGPFEAVEGSPNVGYLEINTATLAHEPFTVQFKPGEPPETYDPAVGVWTCHITAEFFYEGSLIGQGRREIRVNQLGGRRLHRVSDATPIPPQISTILPDIDTADLTICITAESPGLMGQFRVRLFSPHLPEPVDAGSMSLGQEARLFAANLIKAVDSTIANEVSDETLGTIGRVVAEKLPHEVGEALETVWNASNSSDITESERRIPDVLLLTDEWAVPWELMAITLDPSNPGFLGAQVNLGRWPYGEHKRLKSAVQGVHRLGVMVGHYRDARGVRPLPRAEEEGRTLVERYVAEAVNADASAFDAMLAGRFRDGFEFEGLHFAGHGESDPSKGGTYLTFSDGGRMQPLAIGDAPIARTKDSFLFVNACQVGAADEMLGQYSGLAGWAIGAGFRGLVAPLWSVDDDIAQEISLGLYQASAEGQTISSYLREVRGNFRQSEEAPAHTTYMAYVFYGHPALRLGGPDRRSS